MKKYIAHAGIHLGSTLATQNSLRSIEYAAAAGFDFVELDVWITADGVPVVLHNLEINETYRQRADYAPIPKPVNVCESTYRDLCEKYIGKADDEADRDAIPTLSEALKLCKSLGILPMIHPKTYDASSNARIMEVSDAAIGKMQYYIVSSNPSCDYALAQEKDHPCMVIVKDRNDIDKYAPYNNVIIAIGRRNNYEDLVHYAHEKGHPVETTLNDDVHAELIADVINYDYRSPGRFDKYKDVTSKAFEDRTLAAGEKFHFCGNEMRFGTVEASFRMKGKATLSVCGRDFMLDASEMTEFRAAVLVYRREATVTFTAIDEVQLEDLKIQSGTHDIK